VRCRRLDMRESSAASALAPRGAHSSRSRPRPRGTETFAREREIVRMVGLEGMAQSVAGERFGIRQWLPPEFLNRASRYSASCS
jgi:predicted DNA-binding protein (UPF0251 family)